jgi:outer membrane receptor protein involved in Fe transport
MKSVRALALVAFLVHSFTAPGTASAATPALPLADQADEAQFHFLRGNRAYQERRFEDALASYYSSNRLVPNRNVQFNIARCLDRLGRYEEAYRAWSTLLEQALQGKELQAAQEAIEQLRPHLALVDITTTPPGATIYAGRRDLGALGVTPKSLALAPGATKIILAREGFRSVELSAELSRGKQIKLSTPLEQIFGEIELRRVPDDAEIRWALMDGEVLRRGPGTIRVLPGATVLFVSAPGFQTERVEVIARPEARVPVDVLLSAAVAPAGNLVVRSNIPGALIRIDGKEAGFTPAVIDGIAAGLREVTVVEEGRKPFAASVEVRKGESTFVDAHLGRADPEVTAATKSAVASESAPASITVITADEIAAFGYTSLTEALTAIRGTFTSNDRSYESVGFRGFSPPGDYTNRVLVLIDGHVTNDAVTGQGFVGHDFDVDLANVARIEIVRGPGSVLYGTGALFGVINVVTRRPGEGPHVAMNTTAGTMGLLSGRATSSMRKGDGELMVSAAALKSDGESRYTWPAAVTGNLPVTVLHADAEKVFHADLVGRLGPFFLRAGYNDRKKDLPTGAYDTQAVPGTSNHDHRAYAELGMTKLLRGIQVTARAAYDASWYHGQFVAADPKGPDQENLKAQWLTGELRLQLPEILRQHITLGGEVVDQLELQADPPHVGGNPAIGKELVLSAYLIDDIRVSQRLTVNLAMRSDSYTQSSGTTFNPRFAIVGRPYQGGNTKLFFGRSFRVPSANEQANSMSGALHPEAIWSGEVEHTHTISDDLHVIGSFFANWLSNLVTLVGVGSSDYQTIYQNNPERIRSIGVEGELRWEPGGGSLLSASVARQQVVETASTGNLAFGNAPETLFTARALCPLVGLALRLGSELVLDSGRHFRPFPVQFSVDNRVDDAILWNITMSGEYRAHHLRYFVGLFNLLDVHDPLAGFPTSADYPTVLIPRYGRSMRAGLSWAF